MIDSKVTNLQLPVLTDKNVSSSKIAMNYSLLCQVFLYNNKISLPQLASYRGKAQYSFSLRHPCRHSYIPFLELVAFQSPREC